MLRLPGHTFFLFLISTIIPFHSDIICNNNNFLYDETGTLISQKNGRHSRPMPVSKMMEMQKRDISSLQHTSQISTCLPHVPRQCASDPEHSITKSPLT